MNELATANAVLWAPIAGIGVSIIYFLKSNNSQFKEKIVVSAHGAIIALTHISAMAINMVGISNPSFSKPFVATLILPIIFIALSLIKFKGNSNIHVLQIFNILCLMWTYFIGTMAVTGEWL